MNKSYNNAKDYWIPASIVIVIVLFSIVILAMVTVAFKTFTGTVEEKNYDKSLEFSKIYSTSLKQPDDLVRADISIRGDHAYVTVLTDLQYKVEAKIVRPVGVEFDQDMELKPLSAEKPHMRLINIGSQLAPGIWEVRVKVTADDAKIYIFSKRFMKE
jgi:nitrogen fixation protein FixH